MCGIVAVLCQPSTREAPAAGTILAGLDQAAQWLAVDDLASLEPTLDALQGLDRVLRGTPGLVTLLRDPDMVAEVATRTERIGQHLARLDSNLDQGLLDLTPARQERVNATLVALKDAWWAIDRDRLGMARAVRDLIPAGAAPGALDGWWSVQVALASLDRLEVRGRDSAGIHILITGSGLAGPEGRPDDPLFTSGAVRAPEGCLSMVYKAAAEIGELGDNVKALRAAIRADDLLARALAVPEARTTVIAHTRWASVGIISQANAHPLNSEETGGSTTPYVVAALNGDVDNHAELRLAEDLQLAAGDHHRRQGHPHHRGAPAGRRIDRRRGLPHHRGPLRGVGRHRRLDGRGPRRSALGPLRVRPVALRRLGRGRLRDRQRTVRVGRGDVALCAHGRRVHPGQVVRVRRDGAGGLSAMTRLRYDGGSIPPSEDELITAEITTRDIDRAGFHHFLLKELTEAPTSFRKTLRGRIVAGDDGRLSVRVGADTVSPALVAALAGATLRRVLVIGQGTAAVAGQAVAAAIAAACPGCRWTPCPPPSCRGSVWRTT